MLLKQREVATLFGVHPSTIWRWCKAGLIPKPVKVGRGTSRWLKAEVEAALQRMLEARR